MAEQLHQCLQEEYPMVRRLSLAFFVSLCVAIPGFADPPSICDAVAGNLVANCGFEAGVYSSTLSGNTNTSVPNSWTPNAGYDLEPGFNHVTGYANSGSYGLSIGNFDYQPVPALSQTLTDIAGDTYNGSLYVSYGGAGGGDTGAYFGALINGTAVLALNDTTLYGYTQYTFSFVGTGSDVLTIEGNTNPSEWYADDVVVKSSSVVPEPASVFLFGTLIAGVFASRRFSRRLS